MRKHAQTIQNVSAAVYARRIAKTDNSTDELDTIPSDVGPYDSISQQKTEQDKISINNTLKRKPVNLQNIVDQNRESERKSL